ncbi:hypothetical protein ABZS66_25355 [Dactylosporangium sp. NPDC005572]|uniref:hypothetical protein n=1 Tax=Dactylosporangium sp. NPDC005572 TaxID=3156889 RepID=UPI0033AC17D7
MVAAGDASTGDAFLSGKLPFNPDDAILTGLGIVNFKCLTAGTGPPTGWCVL